MVEPKRPVLGYLLYKYLGIEIPKYKKYWEEYCNYMQYLLIMSKP